MRSGSPGQRPFGRSQQKRIKPMIATAEAAMMAKRPDAVASIHGPILIRKWSGRWGSGVSKAHLSAEKALGMCGCCAASICSLDGASGFSRAGPARIPD